MKLLVPIAFPAPNSRLSLNFQRMGLAFVLEIAPPILRGPTVTATLLLRWMEVTVIGAFVAVLATAINYRDVLAKSWLVGTWAPGHTETAATIIAGAALFLGCALAFWKRRQPFVYGVAEIVFGTFSAFQVSWHLWPSADIAKLIGIASALYVVSRGAGNVADALLKETQIERLKIVKSVPPPPEPPEPWPPSILSKSESV